MSKAVFKGEVEDIPTSVWVRAWCQWVWLAAVRLPAILAGLVVVPFAIRKAKRQMANRFGEQACPFPYPGANPEGWVFYNVPWAYRTARGWRGFLWLFGNDEDGFYGDRRGWWSANQDGQERSWWSMYQWAALRNPANNLSRYTTMYGCLVNDCTIEYWGDYVTPDNRPLLPGAHFVVATSPAGRKYYGYRKVTDSGDGTGYNWSLGFKLKPEHADNPQAPDDAHKGFTLRINKID
jgi:hypothetical protein